MDHPVINIPKSKEARHNVYDLSIVLQTRVKRAMGDMPAVKNMVGQAIRFDKGKALCKEDFDVAKVLIVRAGRPGRITSSTARRRSLKMEKWALKQINEMPLPGRALVDVGGQLVEHDTVDPEESEEDDDERPALTAPKLVASGNANTGLPRPHCSGGRLARDHSAGPPSPSEGIPHATVILSASTSSI
jgi:hypothetical protein